MSINGYDYTKQLAKEREYFKDTTRKVKEVADKRVEDANKLAEHVTTKQREKFIEDRAELEKNYQASLDHLKEKARDSMDDNNTKVAEEREKEREAFTQEALKKSKDFDQRLEDIKASYKKAFKSENDRHQELEKTHKDKYDTNVSNLRADQDKKLKDYQERLSGAGADLKDQYNRERQQLVRAHEDRLTDVYKDASNKRVELKDRIDHELKKTKAVHDAEMEQQRQYTQDRLSTAQKKFQERSESLAKDYSERNKYLVDEQQRNTIRTNREHEEQLAEAKRGYNDSLRKIELDRLRRDNGEGEFAEVQDRQQGLKDKIVYDNKMKHLKDELIHAQRAYQARAEEEHEAFKNTLKEQNIEAVARQERKLNEKNAENLVNFAREREKTAREIENREHQNKLDRAAYEAQLMNERNNANKRITQLKENFNQSLASMEEKHKAAITEIEKSSIKDKNDFVKIMQERRADEIFEMKRAFGRMMDATVQDYEQRLATYQRENEYLKMTMNQKIANIVDQTEKQLESQRVLFEDKRQADLKSQQLLMDQREAQLKRNFSDMNISYQKKIDKMQIENDTKFKLMTNDYETKLKELKAQTSKQLAQKDIAHQAELERVKQTYEDEKLRLVHAYESQIESLKRGHEDQMKQMSEYKRLS